MAVSCSSEEWSDEQIVNEVANGRVLLLRDEYVYDCTKFADIHPGGRNYLEQYAGNQVKDVMEKGPHQHSFNAIELIQNYCCGKLVNSQQATTKSLQQLKNDALISNEETISEPVNSINKVNQIQHETNSTEDLVDWNEPMLWQVGGLGSSYNIWVHRPVDKPLRLFKSDICEIFSKTPWYVIPIVWIPVVIYSAILSLQGLITPKPDIDLDTWLLFIFYFVMGILLWTMFEYLLHRFLFHMEPSSNYPKLITLHFLLHGQHHKVPFDPGRLVFPPIPAAVFACVFYFLISCCLSGAIAQAVFSGALCGYICYDLIHYYLHYGRPTISYFKMLKAYHVKHHFEDNNKGFGISSPLWDFPFGTQVARSKTE